MIAAVLVLQVALAAGVEAESIVNRDSPLSPKEQGAWHEVLASGDYALIARTYADYMIEHGRDRYGKVHSPLFMTVLNRKTGKAFKPPYPHVITKPYAPGLRRDHKMRPYDRTYVGSNPVQDIPLYGLLHRLTELTGNKRYGEEADKSIAWFLKNAQEGSGLFPWGSHRYYHVVQDKGVYSSGGYGGHEYNFVWPYWDQNPEALNKFAHGLWNKHIRNKETGHFNRHSKDGSSGMEFPETGACFMEVWAREYGRGGDLEMKRALQTLLKFFRSMRDPKTGAMSWCSAKAVGRRELSNVRMNLSMASKLQDAAGHVEKRDPELAEELRVFVQFIDDEFLSNDYDKILDVAGKGILGWYMVADRTARPEGMTPAPKGADASVGFPVKTADGKPAASLYYLTPWFPNRSYAAFSMLLKERHLGCEEKHKATYRRALLDTADIYMTILPEVQFAQYPDNISDVVELLRYVYTLTKDPMYLRRADQIMKLGLKLFFDETSPLPKITNFDDWYESSSKNESSVEILRQMLELSLDLKTLPEKQRTAPVVDATERDGAWYVDLRSRARQSVDDFSETRALENPPSGDGGYILKYGPNHQHGLYLSQSRSADDWRITLSDSITHIPTAAEADRLNGTMKKFTGKGMTASDITYGGFKDVPVKVTLVIRNNGKETMGVTVAADLHDTYHDNGQVTDRQTIASGKSTSLTITAPAKKWIRRLRITPQENLQLEDVKFSTVKRNKLQD